MIEFLMLIVLGLVLLNSKLWENGYWDTYGKYGHIFKESR